jgi:hypothetical protein
MRVPLKQKQYTSKKTIFIISIILVVLAIGGVVAYKHFHKPKPDFSGTAGVSEVNYGPPTKEEQQAGNDQKEKNVTQQENETKPNDGKATVVITDASYYADSNTVEVRAFVSNIVEDGGTCTVVFEKNGQKVTQTHAAFKDAKTTQCGALDTPRSQFPSTGTWNVTLTYTSSTATGQQTATLKL